jgi:hypothetical protein
LKHYEAATVVTPAGPVAVSALCQRTGPPAPPPRAPTSADLSAAAPRVGEPASAFTAVDTRGASHHYRIQGPSFLVEYDNTQNGANHIQSVWRDFDGDFGRDLLREHYRGASRSHGH